MDYDFTEHYKKGDIIYQARYIERVDISEVNQITLRTIEPSIMIGYIDGGNAVALGLDQKDLIFKTRKDANVKLKEISKNKKHTNATKAKTQSSESDEEDEKLDSYIDGGDENE